MYCPIKSMYLRMNNAYNKDIIYLMHKLDGEDNTYCTHSYLTVAERSSYEQNP